MKTNAELLELCEMHKAAKIEMGRYDEGVPAKVYAEFVRSEDALAGATLEALPRLIAENERLTEWARISVMVAEGNAWGGYEDDEFMGIDWTDHLPSGQYDIWQKLAPEIRSRIEPNAPSGMWVDPSPEGHKSFKEQTP